MQNRRLASRLTAGVLVGPFLIWVLSLSSLSACASSDGIESGVTSDDGGSAGASGDAGASGAAGAAGEAGSDAPESCGNGQIDPGEKCDPGLPLEDPGACPTQCEDGQSCTERALSGAQCQSECAQSQITSCHDGDGCCPAGCSPTSDSDCSKSCGNGAVEPPETCDTAISSGPGACPTSCDDSIACTADQLVGAGCSVSCSNSAVVACASGDGCCPAGCDSSTDSDCSPSCGNGVVEPPETCDTGIASGPGACPLACDDGVACTLDKLVGSGCSVSCSNAPITSCVSGDGCCASACNATTDSDCSASCGNGVVEPPETCDTAIASGAGACPTACNDGVACTLDKLVGSGCSASCSHSTVTACASGDGCCPSACNANNDGDCSASCGNGAVEPPETCDTTIASGPGFCPTTCNDGVACTLDKLVGSGCTASCSNAPITACASGDGCCPSACNALSDSDCSASCGNGVVEPPEKCDTGISSWAGSCPTSCADGNVCTTDTMVGSACSTSCNNSPVTACVSGDGCCPAGCAGSDVDCDPCTGSGWVISEIPGGSMVDVSMALAGDTPLVAYFSQNADKSYIARRQPPAATFSVEEIFGGSPLSGQSDFAALSGVGELVSHHRYGSTLQVGFRAASATSFAWMTVDDEFVSGFRNAVALEPSGVIHVVYQTSATSAPNWATVHYKRRAANGTWSSRELVHLNSSAYEIAGGSVDIAVDTAGYAHIAYNESTTNKVWYARRSPTGSWNTGWLREQVASGGAQGVAIAAAGSIVKVAYAGTNGLRVATRTTTGSWSTTTVDAANARMPSMTIDAMARTHVAYLSGTAGSLAHGYQPLAAGTWQLSGVHGIESGMPSLLSDAHGAVHIAFLEDSYVGGTNGRPRHAYRCFYP